MDETGEQVRRYARYALSLSMVWVGITHFTRLDFFMAIVPPWLPEPVLLIYVSGFFEILGGLGLLVEGARRFAGYGLVALYVAVYPVNIYMLTEGVFPPGVPQERWLLYARMPFQLLFILWALWAAEIFPKRKLVIDEDMG